MDGDYIHFLSKGTVPFEIQMAEDKAPQENAKLLLSVSGKVPEAGKNAVVVKHVDIEICRFFLRARKLLHRKGVNDLSILGLKTTPRVRITLQTGVDQIE